MNLSLLFALVVCLTAGLSQGDAVKAEMKNLEGVWTVTAAEVFGKEVSEEDAKQLKMTFEFKGDKWTMLKDGQKFGEATIKIDLTKKPKALDASSTDGETKSSMVRCIYELTGNTLKFAYRLDDGRPAGFNDKSSLSYILKRQK